MASATSSPTKAQQPIAIASSTSVPIPAPPSSPAHNPPPPPPSPLLDLPSSVAPQKPAPSTLSYSRTLVVARLQEADISWIREQLPDVTTAAYTIDDPSAEYHVPKSKGHEAMVYLTYIIDHYDSLPDIAIFIHSDRFTWHNNDLLEGDLVQSIKRLNADRVVREGYFNLRCHTQPGCSSDNLHLNRTDENGHKPEESVFKKVWNELHPGKTMPDTLSHPCCAQFAVSRKQIRAIPPSQYVTWRQWLLDTDLSDRLSGRIWEYTWHYIFTGVANLCVAPHECYCDGYGVCMRSKADMRDWLKVDEKRKGMEDVVRDWDKQNHEGSGGQEEEGSSRGAEDEEENKRELERQIADMKAELERRKHEAWVRGGDPVQRKMALALEAR